MIPLHYWSNRQFNLFMSEASFHYLQPENPGWRMTVLGERALACSLSGCFPSQEIGLRAPFDGFVGQRADVFVEEDLALHSFLSLQSHSASILNDKYTLSAPFELIFELRTWQSIQNNPGLWHSFGNSLARWSPPFFHNHPLQVLCMGQYEELVTWEEPSYPDI